MSSESAEKPRRASRSRARMVSTHSERPRGGPPEPRREMEARVVTKKPKEPKPSATRVGGKNTGQRGRKDGGGRAGIGYRAYSKFLASNNDFLVFRKFGASSARVLLRLQDEVSWNEAELRKIDVLLEQDKDGRNGRFRGKGHPQRAQLMEALYNSLSRYNAFLIQIAEIGKWPTAEKVNIESIQKWNNEYKDAIDRHEKEYITHTTDLFTLLPRKVAPLRRFLERWDGFALSPWWRKVPPSELPVAQNSQVIYMEDEKIDRFIKFVTVLIWLAMLIAPLWILHFVVHELAKLGIITGFIVLFLGVMAILTEASPGEMLAATAGYAAVIVVFLGLDTGNGPS